MIHKINISLILMLFLLLFSNSFASLSNHPSSFVETVIKGNTKTIELHISNSIASALSYTFNIPVNWVKVEPPAGTVPGNSTLTVNLILDATNLENGNYSTVITLNDPHHGGLAIPVELNVTTTTAVETQDNTAKEYRLFQNYPNPFNPLTKISFSIPESQNISLTIFNFLGKEVKNIFNGFLLKGRYIFDFDAKNFPTGIYFYRLKTNHFTQTRKMVLTK